MTELSPGEYSVQVTDADEAAGTIVVVDFGAGAFPRRGVFEVFKPDNTNQFWAVAVEDTDGSEWAGAAPTIGSYRWKDGTDRSAQAPATVAVPSTSKWLFCWTPTAEDIAADASIRINGPAGSLQPYWVGDALPVANTVSSSGAGGVIADMADAIGLLGTGTYTVTRRGPSVFDAGRRLEPSTSTLQVSGTLVPLTPLELSRLPDGVRDGETWHLYTSTQLVSSQGGFEPDTVNIDGRSFSVEKCARWAQAGNFYVATLVALAS